MEEIRLTTCCRRNPIKNGIFSMSTGAGFHPSTVCTTLYKTLQHPLNCGNRAVRKTSTNTPENEKQNSKAPENGWQKVDDQASGGKRLIFSVVNSLLVFRDPFPAFGSLILLIGSGIELSIKKWTNSDIYDQLSSDQNPCTGWLIGIFIMAYYKPYITGYIV